MLFISMMIRAVYNEIESIIPNCSMSRDEKSMKKKVKIKTQNEKIVETDMDIWH